MVYRILISIQVMGFVYERKRISRTKEEIFADDEIIELWEVSEVL